MSNLDPDAGIPIECPKCGHHFEKSIGWIQANPKFTCPGCGQPFDAKQLLSGLKDADKIIDDFLRDIGRN